MRLVVTCHLSNRKLTFSSSTVLGRTLTAQRRCERLPRAAHCRMHVTCLSPLIKSFTVTLWSEVACRRSHNSQWQSQNLNPGVWLQSQHDVDVEVKILFRVLRLSSGYCRDLLTEAVNLHSLRFAFNFLALSLPVCETLGHLLHSAEA